MFLIDDILLFPIKGLCWAVRAVHDGAKQELEGEEDHLRMELSELYMMLETERITEQEFTDAEKLLLDRLDAISSREQSIVSREPDEQDVSDVEDGDEHGVPADENLEEA